MANPNIANVITHVDYCSDLEYLTQQYEELIERGNYAVYEQDMHGSLQDDSPLAEIHQAYINALWAVIELVRLRIKELGGTLPGYGEVA